MNVDQQTTPQAGMQDTPTGKIERLLADGKTKQAVELAKEHHKKSKTAQTEALLVRAYVARIEQFRAKGMAEEAQTLLSLVWERYPAQRSQVAPLRMSGAVAEGRLGELVAPLADPALPADQRQLIEEHLRRQVIDPSALASVASLPPEHSLRVAAAAVARALEAVTSRPVTDEEIALPEVSRRSALAPWKLLIRAIAAFYRRNDDACRRALDGIEPDAAVAPLAKAIRAMVDPMPAGGGGTGMAATALQARVVSNIGPLATALAGIDKACRDEDDFLLKRSIRDAIRYCTEVRPDFVVRLKQLISVGCYAHAAPIDSVITAMGPSLRDAFFWRQLALAAGRTMAPLESAAYWERFCRHSIAEGAFTGSSPEAGAVWLRAAEQLAQVPQHAFNQMRDRIVEMDAIGSYYHRQPAEIAALRPESSHEYAKRVLDPDKAFEKAVSIAPTRKAFGQWWNWAERNSLPPKKREDIAMRWSAAQPGDIEPMLILADLAEKRNALSMALKRIAAAEAIDPNSAQVREARLRLMLAIAWRHFDNGNLNLLEADVRDLAGLPGLRDTDGQAVVSFMAAAWRVRLGDHAGAAEHIDAGMRRLGPLVGWCTARSVLEQAGALNLDPQFLPPPPSQPSPAEVARAEANVTRLAATLEMKIYRPADWDPAIATTLAMPTCPLTSAELLWIGRSAMARMDYKLAYQASSAGLAQSRLPADSARFLLLRAQSMQDPWASERVEQCLGGALELAKTAHDEKLLTQVLAEIDEQTQEFSFFGERLPRAPMTPVNAEEVLRHERQAPQPPTNGVEANAQLIPSLAEKAGEQEEDDDDFLLPWSNPEDDDEDDIFALKDDDEDAGSDSGDPSEFGPLAPLLMQFLKNRGVSIEQAMANPRLMLDLFADPTKGMTPQQLEALRKELQGFDSIGRTAPHSGGSRRSGRRKRRRR